MKIRDSGRGLVRCLSLAAAAMLALSAAGSQRAEALSLINPGAVPAAKYASNGRPKSVAGMAMAGMAMAGMVAPSVAAASEVAAPRGSVAAGFARAGPGSGITGIIFTGTSTMRRPIITRTGTAGSSGPITVRAASVITASGTMADILCSERHRDG